MMIPGYVWPSFRQTIQCLGGGAVVAALWKLH
jgi:hypothetical protein